MKLTHSPFHGGGVAVAVHAEPDHKRTNDHDQANHEKEFHAWEPALFFGGRFWGDFGGFSEEKEKCRMEFALKFKSPHVEFRLNSHMNTKRSDSLNLNSLLATKKA